MLSGVSSQASLPPTPFRGKHYFLPMPWAGSLFILLQRVAAQARRKRGVEGATGSQKDRAGAWVNAPTPYWSTLVKMQLLGHFVGSCGFHTNPSVYLVPQEMRRTWFLCKKQISASSNAPP